jgi:hypothetical protein
MAKLTSTVTPQGIVGVCPFLDVASDALPNDGCVAVLHGCATRQRRNGAAVGGRRRGREWCSRPARSMSTTRRSPCDRPRGRSSICRCPRRGNRACVKAFATGDAGARDGWARRRGLYSVDLSSRSPSCSGTKHAGCPTTSSLADATVGSASRQAESLNLAAAAPVCLFEWARRRRSGTVALDDRSRGRPRYRSPLTAMKGSATRWRSGGRS